MKEQSVCILVARADDSSPNLGVRNLGHACLKALSTGTPAVAMAHYRKFTPLKESIVWKRSAQIAGAYDLAAAVLAHARHDGLRECAIAMQQRSHLLLLPVSEHAL